MKDCTGRKLEIGDRVLTLIDMQFAFGFIEDCRVAVCSIRIDSSTLVTRTDPKQVYKL